ncbi:MAG: phage tail protein [Pseudomonadota bacterium]
MIVTHAEASYAIQDPANREIQGREASAQISRNLFPMQSYAAAAAERLLKSGAYPGAVYTFKANRAAFRLRPGDLFVLNYAPYNLAGVVCRVSGMTEHGMEDELIEITAVEDVDYIAQNMAVEVLEESEEDTYWEPAEPVTLTT